MRSMGQNALGHCFFFSLKVGFAALKAWKRPQTLLKKRFDR